MEMLYVCSSWRQAALEFIWKDLNLIIRHDSSKVLISGLPWPYLSYVPHGLACLVENVKLTVPMSIIVNGVAHGLLSEFMRDTVEFSAARRLNILVTDWSYKTLRLTDEAIGNVTEFAHLLQSATQGVATVEVAFTGDSGCDNYWQGPPVGEFDEEAMGIFMNLMCANIKFPGLEIKDMELKRPSTVDHIPQLSSLNLRCKRMFDLSTSLVHKSSSSLQFLRFGLYDPRELVYDIHGNSIVYPKMKRLVIFKTPLGYFKEPAKAPDTVPFPVLESLKLLIRYPFADDVLFRGNSTTLEELDIILNTVLHDNQVFKSKDRILHTLTLGGVNYNGGISLLSETVLNDFLGDLIEPVRKLVISDPLLIKPLIDAATHGFNNLQVLNLVQEQLPFYDILRLLKAFPVLSKLVCGVDELGSELKHIAADDLPDYIASTYKEAGKNMQVWKLPCVRSINNTHITEYVVLLALCCPRLRRIDLAENVAAKYRSEIAKALESKLYSKYTSQLDRLVHAAFS
ncbi:hypothetical protein LPJ71_002788 [Coemansia sp. S17]|nr:hypothetical protein LPJ71_002788 [Coemansia sp. S17]